MNFQIVIPARGGSKRFPGKNIALLNGIPLIAHSILYALKNKIGAEVFVNTDNKLIADVAKEFGAKIVERPSQYATDFTPTVDVLKHQVEYFEENGILCDAIILLQATNPLRATSLLQNAANLFEKSGRNSLASYCVLNKKFGSISNKNFFSPKNYVPGQRMQDIEPLYFEDGCIYITNKTSILNNEIMTADVYPLINTHFGARVDIDEKEDLALAEYFIKTRL